MIPLLLTSLVLSGCFPKEARDDPEGGAGGADGGGQAALLGLGLAPNDPIVGVGETVEFEVKAYYEDSSYAIITDQITWTTTEPRVADFKHGALVQALSEGVADIIATDVSGVSAKVELTVVGEGARIQSVQLSPPDLEIRVDDYAQLSAIATYDDGTTGNLAGSCGWSVDRAEIAAVDSAGGVTGRAVGDTTVRASCEGVDLQAPVTVREEGADVGEPDLDVVGFDAAVSGYDVEYAIQIENRGDASAAGFFVDVYLDHAPDGSGEDFDGYAYVSSLAAGASALVYVDLEGVPDGSYGSYTLVDPEGLVPDSSRGNNQAGPLSVIVEAPTSSVGPELTITFFDGITDGDYTYYQMEILNAGDADANNFWMDLHFDAWSTPDVCEEGDLYAFVETLAPGEYAGFEGEVDDGPWWGAWDSALVVDSCDDVAESNESNNIAWVTLEP